MGGDNNYINNECKALRYIIGDCLLVNFDNSLIVQKKS